MGSESAGPKAAQIRVAPGYILQTMDLVSASLETRKHVYSTYSIGKFLGWGKSRIEERGGKGKGRSTFDANIRLEFALDIRIGW